VTRMWSLLCLWTVSFPAPRGKAGEKQESAGRPNTQYLSNEQTIREIIGKNLPRMIMFIILHRYDKILIFFP
jgi:hypothetical protein